MSDCSVHRTSHGIAQTYFVDELGHKVLAVRRAVWCLRSSVAAVCANMGTRIDAQTVDVIART